MTISYLRNLIVVSPELFEEMEQGLIKLRTLATRVVPQLEKSEPWQVPEMINTLEVMQKLSYELLDKWDRPED